jgi:hypothetical protein
MTFIPFDDVDEMFAAIRRGTERANQLASPEQKALTYGDYWMREWDTGYGEIIQIFGYIMTQEEIYSDPVYEDIDSGELEWEKEDAKANYDNGYRFGRAYSVVVPEGELGDTHVYDMTPITKEQFLAAKENGWNL